MTRRAALAERRKMRRVRDARYAFDQSFLDAFRPTTWTATYEVGAGKTYATIGAANAQITSDRGWGGGNPVPWDRYLVLVYPGDYPERVSLLHFVDYVGTSGNPRDVNIHADAGYEGEGGLIWHVTMAADTTSYVAHMTVRLTDHPSALSDDKSQVMGRCWGSYATLIFEDVVFILEDTSADIGGESENIEAMDGEDSLTIFYRCVICGDHARPGILSHVNDTFSARSAGNAHPSRVIAHDCLYATRTREKRTTVWVADFGAGHGDIFAVIGGEIRAPKANDYALVSWSWGGSDDFDSQHYIDPKTFKDIYTGSFWGGEGTCDPQLLTGIHNEVYDYHEVAPVEGISPLTRDVYYPNLIGTPADLAPTTGATAPSALTAHRIYYVPVVVPASHVLDSITVNVATADAEDAVSASVYLDSNTWGGFIIAAGRGTPYSKYSYGAGAVASSPGALVMAPPLPVADRLIVPGMTPLYVAISCSGTDAQFTTATTISGDYPVYYEDPVSPYAHPTTATPLALPAGTPFPVVTLNCS